VRLGGTSGTGAGDEHLERDLPRGPARPAHDRIGDLRPVILIQGVLNLAGEVNVMIGANVIGRVKFHHRFAIPNKFAIPECPSAGQLALYY
jgi:hypothetical protein